MKLYYPNEYYDKNYRGQLFPLLKPFIKNKAFTDRKRVEHYGISEKDFQFVDSVEESDFVILPMSWNYYIKTKRIKLAEKLIEDAALKRKIVLSWNAGDFGVKVPRYKNVRVFRMGGYASRNQIGHEGIPVFIEDKLRKYQQENHFDLKFTDQPIIGFCGQANLSKIHSYKEQFKICLKNLRSHLNISAEEPQKVISSTSLRGNILDKLTKSSLINDNFILRKHYRAGVKNKEDREKTTSEFYNNISSSQYVLCVRGAGNFSVRFYETLMMGRIPVYIHTDGFLPLSDRIKWKNQVVWIDFENRNRIDEIVSNFHRKLDKDQLNALCLNNRRIWEEMLTLKGFFQESLKSKE